MQVNHYVYLHCGPIFHGTFFLLSYTFGHFGSLCGPFFHGPYFRGSSSDLIYGPFHCAADHFPWIFLYVDLFSVTKIPGSSLGYHCWSPMFIAHWWTWHCFKWWLLFSTLVNNIPNNAAWNCSVRPHIYLMISVHSKLYINSNSHADIRFHPSNWLYNSHPNGWNTVKANNVLVPNTKTLYNSNCHKMSWLTTT